VPLPAPLWGSSPFKYNFLGSVAVLFVWDSRVWRGAERPLSEILRLCQQRRPPNVAKEMIGPKRAVGVSTQATTS
jgi:hypothetical protein